MYLQGNRSVYSNSESYTVPVKIVFEFVVAPQCCQGAIPDRIWEKHLGTGINPDLRRYIALDKFYYTTLQSF